MSSNLVISAPKSVSKGEASTQSNGSVNPPRKASPRVARKKEEPSSSRWRGLAARKRVLAFVTAHGQKRQQFDPQSTSLPLLVSTCVRLLSTEERIRTDGLFRISGSLLRIKEILKLFKRQPNRAVSILEEEDVHIISGVLKSFLRDLKEPMLTFELYDAWLFCSRMSDPALQRGCITHLLHLLPTGSRLVLSHVLELLHAVQANAEYNRMTSKNLAVVFGPTLLRPASDDLELALENGRHTAELVRLLIQGAPDLLAAPFEANYIANRAPPALVAMVDSACQTLTGSADGATPAAEDKKGSKKSEYLAPSSSASSKSPRGHRSPLRSISSKLPKFIQESKKSPEEEDLPEQTPESQIKEKDANKQEEEATDAPTEDKATSVKEKPSIPEKPVFSSPAATTAEKDPDDDGAATSKSALTQSSARARPEMPPKPHVMPPLNLKRAASQQEKEGFHEETATEESSNSALRGSLSPRRFLSQITPRRFFQRQTSPRHQSETDLDSVKRDPNGMPADFTISLPENVMEGQSSSPLISPRSRSVMLSNQALLREHDKLMLAGELLEPAPLPPASVRPSARLLFAAPPVPEELLQPLQEMSDDGENVEEELKNIKEDGVEHLQGQEESNGGGLGTASLQLVQSVAERVETDVAEVMDKAKLAIMMQSGRMNGKRAVDQSDTDSTTSSIPSEFARAEKRSPEDEATSTASNTPVITGERNKGRGKKSVSNQKKKAQSYDFRKDPYCHAINILVNARYMAAIQEETSLRIAARQVPPGIFTFASIGKALGVATLSVRYIESLLDIVPRQDAQRRQWCAARIQATWKGYVVRQSLKGVEKGAQARYNHAFRRLYTATKYFVANMNEVCDVYEASFRRLGSNLVTPKQTEKIFAHVSEVRDAHAELLAALAEERQYWPVLSGAGNLLATCLVPRLRVYEKYVQVNKEATSTLHYCSSSSVRLRDFLHTKRARSRADGMSLSELLSLPLLHVTQLAHHAHKIASATLLYQVAPPFERTRALEAQCAALYVRAIVDELGRHGEQEKLAMISRMIQGNDEISIDKGPTDRRLVHRGAVTIASEKRYLFVFNDILLVTRSFNKGLSFKYKYALRLDDCTIESLPPKHKYHRTGFSIDYPTRRYQVWCKDRKDRSHWFRTLSALIARRQLGGFGLALSNYTPSHHLEGENSTHAKDGALTSSTSSLNLQGLPRLYALLLKALSGVTAECLLLGSELAYESERWLESQATIQSQQTSILPTAADAYLMVMENLRALQKTQSEAVASLIEKTLPQKPDTHSKPEKDASPKKLVEKNGEADERQPTQDQSTLKKNSEGLSSGGGGTSPAMAQREEGRLVNALQQSASWNGQSFPSNPLQYSFLSASASFPQPSSSDMSGRVPPRPTLRELYDKLDRQQLRNASQLMAVADPIRIVCILFTYIHQLPDRLIPYENVKLRSLYSDTGMRKPHFPSFVAMVRMLPPSVYQVLHAFCFLLNRAVRGPKKIRGHTRNQSISRSGEGKVRSPPPTPQAEDAVPDPKAFKADPSTVATKEKSKSQEEKGEATPSTGNSKVKAQPKLNPSSSSEGIGNTPPRKELRSSANRPAPPRPSAAKGRRVTSRQLALHVAPLLVKQRNAGIALAVHSKPAVSVVETLLVHCDRIFNETAPANALYVPPTMMLSQDANMAAAAGDGNRSRALSGSTQQMRPYIPPKPSMEEMVSPRGTLRPRSSSDVGLRSALGHHQDPLPPLLAIKPPIPSKPGTNDDLKNKPALPEKPESWERNSDRASGGHDRPPPVPTAPKPALPHRRRRMGGRGRTNPSGAAKRRNRRKQVAASMFVGSPHENSIPADQKHMGRVPPLSSSQMEGTVPKQKSARSRRDPSKRRSIMGFTLPHSDRHHHHHHHSQAKNKDKDAPLGHSKKSPRHTKDQALGKGEEETDHEEGKKSSRSHHESKMSRFRRTVSTRFFQSKDFHHHHHHHSSVAGDIAVDDKAAAKSQKEKPGQREKKEKKMKKESHGRGFFSRKKKGTKAEKETPSSAADQEAHPVQEMEKVEIEAKEAEKDLKKEKDDTMMKNEVNQEKDDTMIKNEVNQEKDDINIKNEVKKEEEIPKVGKEIQEKEEIHHVVSEENVA